MHPTVKHLPVGDRAIMIELGDTIDSEINRRVHQLDRAISQAQIPGVGECVPTYRSLLVYYDPLKKSYERLVFELKDLEERLDELTVSTQKKVVEVPVAYGGAHGPDLNYVAEYHKLTEDEVVQLHSNREYLVYMIGFIAGFPYLGEVPDEIATPRMKTPRLKVPAGSVGIAEKQTGIYPIESPGGWQIIGRTPVKLFDPEKRPPALIQPGDTLKFKPINSDKFSNISQDQQV